MYKHLIERHVLGSKQCQTLIDWLEDQVGAEAVLRDKEGQTYADIAYDDPGFAWLYEKIEETIFQVNSRGWEFDLRDWQQPLRVARYDINNGMYWHMDYTSDDASKIAMSVALNDPMSYRGGGLKLLETKPLDPLSKGHGVFFPAFHGHRVEPIMSGSRYVLLGWYSGPRFR